MDIVLYNHSTLNCTVLPLAKKAPLKTEMKVPFKVTDYSFSNLNLIRTTPSLKSVDTILNRPISLVFET